MIHLILQNGERRLFPDVIGWHLVEQSVKDKEGTFKTLEKWFKERKMVLKKNPKD